MTAPVPMTYTDTTLDAADLNTGLRDPAKFALNPPIMRARANATQSVNDSTFTSLVFGLEDVDTAYGASSTGHSTSSNTSRFTAVYAGWYLVCGGASFASSGTGRRGVRLAVNGTATPASGVIDTAATGSRTHSTGTELLYLNVGDYVEVQAFHEAGAPLNTGSATTTTESNNRLNVVWVSN